MPGPFLRIANPKKPGEYLVLAERDFDPAKHQLFGQPSVDLDAPVRGVDEPPIAIGLIEHASALDDDARDEPPVVPSAPASVSTSGDGEAGAARGKGKKRKG